MLHRKPCVSVLSFFALAAVGCNDGPTQPAAMRIDTLLTNLKYAEAMWISGGGVYFTETRDISSSFGDDLRLSRYDLANRQVQVLIDRPVNARALVVTTPDRVFLAGSAGNIPGQSGRVSMAQLTSGSWSETHLLNVAIAATDMFLESNGDIYLIGMSDQAGASNLYRLPASNYAGGATVIATGLGRSRSITKVAADIYYGKIGSGNGIRRIRGGVDEVILANTSANSLTSDGTYLYYSDYSQGQIRRVHLTTLAHDTLMTGLTRPLSIRYEPVSRRLFVLETGTPTAEYADGMLKVISNLR